MAVCWGVRGKGILFIRSLRPDGGVIFLFSAKRPLRKVQLSSYSRRAGQRRCFQRICLAGDYMGPAFTSFRQSLPTEKSLPRPTQVTAYTIATNLLLPQQEHRCTCRLSSRKIHLMQMQLRADVVMLFAVERLSERSEDWPTNGTA